MIKFQQSQALTSHFEIFWSIVIWDEIDNLPIYFLFQTQLKLMPLLAIFWKISQWKFRKHFLPVSQNILDIMHVAKAMTFRKKKCKTAYPILMLLHKKCISTMVFSSFWEWMPNFKVFFYNADFLWYLIFCYIKYFWQRLSIW